MSNQNAPSRATKSAGTEPGEPTRTAPAWAGRVRIVAVALAASSLIMAVAVAWRPGVERNDLNYDAVAATRDATWATAVTTGIAMAVAAVAFGIATCLLVTSRGGRTATVGSVATCLGGIVFCGASVAFGTLGWYVTDQAALPAETGAELLSHIEENFERIGVLLMPGFLLFTLGSLVLAAALWRSRAVPRWWPIVFGILTVVLFAGLDPRVMDLVQAGQTALLVVVAGYTWRAAKAG